MIGRTLTTLWKRLHLQNLQRGTHPLRVIARLKPGVDLAQAQAELDAIGANLARLHPDNNRDKGILAIPLAASYIPARRATRIDPMVALRYE